LQDMEVWARGRMFDSMVSCYLQQWMQQLLADYTHLEALRISSDANRYLPIMPAGNLLSLRHVELALSNDLDRLEPFLIGLSFCSKLEALKITDTNVNLSCSKSHVPCFSIFGAASLRQIELLGVVPGIMMQLPSQCLLRLSASQHYSSHPWESYQDGIKDFTSVLWLHQESSEAWPAGLQDYSRLQYLQLTCTDVIELSLADMSHIPHVRIDVTGMASLLLTRGAWQSLEVHCRRELFLTFSDVDAFVRETQHFLFSRWQQSSILKGCLCAHSRCLQGTGEALLLVPIQRQIGRLQLDFEDECNSDVPLFCCFSSLD